MRVVKKNYFDDEGNLFIKPYQLKDLAEIYEVSLNNNAKASEYYQKIIIDFPGSLYVTEARKRFRLLRGDNPS